MNHLLLTLFAAELNGRLAGRTVGKICWLRPLLVVPLTGRAASEYLVTVTETPGPMCLLSDSDPLAGLETSAVLGAVGSGRVTAVGLHANDRIIELSVEPKATGRAAALTLQFHLYGSHATIQLERDGKPLQALGEPARKREVTRQPAVPLARIDATALARLVAVGSEPRSLAREVPGLDEALQVVFARDDGSLDVDALLSFRDALVGGKGRFALSRRSGAGRVVPVPAGEGGAAYGSTVDALKSVGEGAVGEAHAAIIRRESAALRRRQASQAKLLKRLAADLDRAQGHEHIRRDAEILSAFQSRVPRGAGTVELPDPYQDGRTVRIELDPSLPLETQIGKRFKRAAKLQKSQEHTRRRIELVKAQLRELTSGLESIDAAGSPAEAVAIARSLVQEVGLEPSSREHRNTIAPAQPFRRFDLDDTWFVWVGRSNTENDELTFHVSSPTDMWFHAQGVPGSHVVLRRRGGSGEPPQQILERAASVAAHFSKARHSGLVPVIYTQRKYVRKPRGAKPGQVICERERMVMVEPKLPAPPQ